MKSRFFVVCDDITAQFMPAHCCFVFEAPLNISRPRCLSTHSITFWPLAPNSMFSEFLISPNQLRTHAQTMFVWYLGVPFMAT